MPPTDRDRSPAQQLFLEALARTGPGTDPSFEERVGECLALDRALCGAFDLNPGPLAREVGEGKLLALLDVFHVTAQRLELPLELRRRVRGVVRQRLVPGVAHLALVYVVHELHDQMARLVRPEDFIGVTFA